MENVDTEKHSTGNRNAKRHNTGSYNTGSCNVGYRNTGRWNTGDRNTGDNNAGHYNAGDCNTGDFNTGRRNAGSSNTGSRNSGNYNVGSYNAGGWNEGNYNVGYFNTITPTEILVFNKPCSLDLWEQVEKPNWLYVSLSKWIREKDMTDEEKTLNPSYETTGGYLKVYPSLEKAYAEAWEKTSKRDRELTFKLPNFDIDVFKEIFGFVPTLKKTITIDGKDIEVSGEVFDKISELIKQ